MRKNTFRLSLASALVVGLAGCGTSLSLSAEHPAVTAQTPSHWTTYDYNPQHNAVFPTTRTLS